MSTAKIKHGKLPGQTAKYMSNELKYTETVLEQRKTIVRKRDGIMNEICQTWRGMITVCLIDLTKL
jgi:hypothetical protein